MNVFVKGKVRIFFLEPFPLTVLLPDSLHLDNSERFPVAGCMPIFRKALAVVVWYVSLYYYQVARSTLPQDFPCTEGAL